MKITTFQIQAIHAKLPDEIKGDKQAKEELVIQFTGDQTKRSTKDLTFDQANQLLISLKGSPINYDNWAYINFTDKQQRYIYSLVMQMGWTTRNQKQKVVADLFRLSEWLKSNKAPVQKRISKMSTAELSKIIAALESMTIKSH